MSDEEWTKEKLQEFCRLLRRHLIGIVGNAQRLDESGKVLGQREYAVSGTVVSLNKNDWYVLIAGHSVTKYFAAIVDPLNCLTPGMLAFEFSKKVEVAKPIPFSIANRTKTVKYCKKNGLDYALYPLASSEKEKLKENGIVEFPLKVTDRPREAAFSTYYGVGFPREATIPELVKSKIVAANIRPDCFPLSKIPDQKSETHDWFTARVTDMGRIKSYVGVSGGPMMGFVQKDGTADCYLLAIQSWWDEVDIVFGCNIDTIYEDSKEALEAMKS